MLSNLRSIEIVYFVFDFVHVDIFQTLNKLISAELPRTAEGLTTAFQAYLSTLVDLVSTVSTELSTRTVFRSAENTDFLHGFHRLATACAENILIFPGIIAREFGTISALYANSCIFRHFTAAMTAILASAVLTHTTFKANRSSRLHFIPTVFTIHKSYLHVIDNQAFTCSYYICRKVHRYVHIKIMQKNRRNSIQNFGDCLFI